MLKLAIATDDETPPAVRLYRTFGPISFMEKQFPNFRVDYVPARHFLAHEMNAFPYDIVLVERPITWIAAQIVEQCKSQGVVVWLDLDDNLFQIPSYNDFQDYFRNNENVNQVQKMLSVADLVTVTTAHLQRLYGGINRNTHIIPNAWCDFRFPMLPAQKENKAVRIAWRGGSQHGGDVFPVRSVIKDVIVDPAFEFTLFGGRSRFEDYLSVPDKSYQPFTTLFTYLQSFILSKPDYLFVPLQINDFNRSKSNCSWIEATIAGAVTIAPMGLPEFDQPGVIRYKDNANLKVIFAGIKKGKYDKVERVEASRKALFERYRLSQVNFARKELLEGLFSVAEKKEVADV